jgi:choline monooxygenase
MNLLDLYIDPDITRASTIPAAVYSDPEIYQVMLDKIFATSWQVIEVDPDSHVNVFPFLLLEGSLDEPLILVRKEDNWKCLSNVCTHRGNILVTGPGNFSSLICGYHGRCFDLDGQFKSMPAFTGAMDFPSASDNLPALPHARMGPLHLTSIIPDTDLKEVLAPLSERMAWFPWETLGFLLNYPGPTGRCQLGALL